MLLLVGLGNPGTGYAKHRHNIGFMAVDAIARCHGFGPFRAKFRGLIAEGEISGRKVLALKPETFMNESGQSVEAARAFYKIPPEDVIVLHDEIDLAAGKVRVKRGAMPGTTGCAPFTPTSAPITAACASASATPVIRTKSRGTCSRTSPGPTPSGWKRCSTRWLNTPGF